MTSHGSAALARKTVTAFGGWSFGSASSAPMVVLVGGIVGTYAATGVTSLPLLFLVIGFVVWLLTIGYTAMAREAPHPAAYYAILTRGLGRGWGVAAGMGAFVFYNVLQISLYGLLGAFLHDILGGIWWVWAGIALVVVAVLGVRAIAVSTRLLATILIVSLMVILVFVVAALIDPAHGLSWEGFSPSGLFVSGIGGAAALTVAAFMGVETPASFAEEAVDQDAIDTSVRGGVWSLALVYALAAFAMGVGVGPAQVSATAADGGLPFSILERAGGYMTPLAEAVFVLAVLTSMVAFHNVIARNVLGMASDGVLPAGLARSRSATRVSAPRGGSLLQTGCAAVVVALFALAGADPQKTLFTWLSTLGALGLLCLLVAASVATMAYFNRASTTTRPGALTTTIAPLLGIVLGAVVIGAMIINVGSLLAAPAGSLLPYLLPLIVVAVAIGGGMWAGWLRTNRPEVYTAIGQGRPDAYAVPDDLGIRF